MDLRIHHLNGEIINKEPNDILDNPCFDKETSPNILLLEDLDGE